ncbi:MAG: ABC transporter permease [Pseudomonadota bacterium]
MHGWLPVFLREMLILRRRFWRTLASMAVSPLLYLIAFGYALGGEQGGRAYLAFLVPGLVAMSSMTQAWAIATDINVARFYWHVFEEFQAAPLPNPAYVLGEVLAGMARACLGVLVILALGLAAGVRVDLGPWFWLAVGLNSFAFASLAVAMAMQVKSHADQGMLSSFIITPMAFLGGTVFPLERLPGWAQALTEVLPLTHASRAIRAAALGQPAAPLPYLLLLGLGLAFFWLAVHSVNRARE